METIIGSIIGAAIGVGILFVHHWFKNGKKF